jgi:hypothetical protein
MIAQHRKPSSIKKKPTVSAEEKEHLNELLDEALEETFPASDPPAMLEPVPDLQPPKKRDNK